MQVIRKNVLHIGPKEPFQCAKDTSEMVSNDIAKHVLLFSAARLFQTFALFIMNLFNPSVRNLIDQSMMSLFTFFLREIGFSGHN